MNAPVEAGAGQAMTAPDRDTLTRNLAGRPGYRALQAEVAGFYYLEADLLDNRLYDDWLALLHDDIVYFMPMRRNVPLVHRPEDENTCLLYTSPSPRDS